MENSWIHLTWNALLPSGTSHEATRPKVSDSCWGRFKGLCKPNWRKRTENVKSLSLKKEHLRKQFRCLLVSKCTYLVIRLKCFLDVALISIFRGKIRRVILEVLLPPCQPCSLSLETSTSHPNNLLNRGKGAGCSFGDLEGVLPNFIQIKIPPVTKWFPSCLKSRSSLQLECEFFHHIQKPTRTGFRFRWYPKDLVK